MGDEEECKILQEEELEVLRSIYEGDSAFTIHSDTKFQYKMGSQESDRYESFYEVDLSTIIFGNLVVYLICLLDISVEGRIQSY